MLRAGEHEGQRLPGWEVRWDDDDDPVLHRGSTEHAAQFLAAPIAIGTVCRKTPFLEFEPVSAVKFDPDLTGGFRVKWT